MRSRACNVQRAVLVAATGAALSLLAACAPPPVEPLAPVIDRFEVTASGLSAPALVPLGWTVRDPNGDTLTCRIDADGDGVWDQAMTPCQTLGGRNFPAAEGSYVARLEVADALHAPVTATAAYTVDAGPTESFDIVVQQVTATDPRVSEAIDEAVARWTPVIVRGVTEAEVHQDPGTCLGEFPGFDGVIDDVVIDVAVVGDIGVMGDATTCVNGPEGLPRLSMIRLDSHWIDWMYTHGYLGDLVAHEMGHTLGFTGPAWWAFRQDTGADGFLFVGPRAVAEWSRIGGTGSVPLNEGGDHWNETILQDELMTCYIENLTAHPLSALTAAAMADLGYHVSLAAAEPWDLPAEPGYITC